MVSLIKKKKNLVNLADFSRTYVKLKYEELNFTNIQETINKINGNRIGANTLDADIVKGERITFAYTKISFLSSIVIPYDIIMVNDIIKNQKKIVDSISTLNANKLDPEIINRIVLMLDNNYNTQLTDYDIYSFLLRDLNLKLEKNNDMKSELLIKLFKYLDFSVKVIEKKNFQTEFKQIYDTTSDTTVGFLESVINFINTTIENTKSVKEDKIKALIPKIEELDEQTRDNFKSLMYTVRTFLVNINRSLNIVNDLIPIERYVELINSVVFVS